MDGALVGTSGSHNPSSTLWSWKKAEFSDAYHIESISNLENLQTWNIQILELFGNSTTLLQASTNTLQKWTERRKHPLTLPVCLMNFNLILPFLFSFFFLIPLYIFRISGVFINKVLKWFDGLNLSFFYNHFTSFTFQKRTLLKCLNIFSSLAVSVNDHVFNQRGNLSQLLSNFHSEFVKIWHEDIRYYSFMVPGYLYCCFY